MQGMLQEVGVTVNLNRVPVSTFWSEHYMQAPFYVSYWPADREPDNILSMAFATNSPFNESGWGDPRVDELIVASRGERDLAVRKQQLAEIQQTISRDGGVIIPYAMPVLSAVRDNVHGYVPSSYVMPKFFVWLAPQS